MKGYFRYFAIPFAIVLVLGLVTLGFKAANGPDDSEMTASANTERETTERVFDYGEVLTEEEEDLLRQQIAEKESVTKTDIVLVTLNESLVEYAAGYEEQIGEVPTSQCVMVYADNFYDDNKFGYNKPVGDGVLFLDNIYREDDGHVYSWMSTCGKAEDEFSSEMIDNVLQSGLPYADESPYQMYSTWISEYSNYMTGKGEVPVLFHYPVILIVSLVVAGVFIGVNHSGKVGNKTVSDTTYVAGGKPVLKKETDRFINKTVTKTKIESSSSGGGGSHSSSSGASHGGGGCSR